MVTKEKKNNYFTFAMQLETYSKAMCKSIMNMGALKQMIFRRATFDMYEVIAQLNAYLGDDSIMKMTGMDSIVVEVMVQG